MKERNYLFDNLKFFLIVLVVFGHSLEEISLEHNYAIIRAWIYSFHMPAFVFISGYFSKCDNFSESIKVSKYQAK